MRLVVDDPTFISKFNELRLERNGKKESKEGAEEESAEEKKEEIVFSPTPRFEGWVFICFSAIFLQQREKS